MKNSHRKKRIVRKEPLGTRLLAKPFDWWLQFNELVETVEWESYASLISIRGALVSNALLYICRVVADTHGLNFRSLFSNSYDQDDIFEQDISSNKLVILLCNTIIIIGVLLVVISVFNTFLAFREHRQYTLLGRDINNRPQSSSSILVKIPIDGSSSVQNVTEIPQDLSIDLDNSYTESKEDLKPFIYAWALNVWDPPAFCLYYFSVFSPINAFGLWFVPISPTLLLLLALVSFVLYNVIQYFLTLQKDKEIIQKEVFAEYETQIVKPLISVPTQDAMVGSDGSVDFFLPSLNNQYKIHTRHANSQADTEDHSPLISFPKAVQSAPVFPSSLKIANAVRRQSGLLETKLYYHPSGYFTGNEVSTLPKTNNTTTQRRSRKTWIF